MVGYMLVAATILCGEPGGLNGLATLEVLPATSMFEVGDPLILKLSVLNHSKTDLRFPRQVASVSGLIEWELMPPTGTKWRRAEAQFEGLAEIVQPQIIASQETFSTCVVIHKANGGLNREVVFETPGEYQLRARVPSETVILQSEPIKLIVHKSTPEKWAYIWKTHRHFMVFVLPSRRSAKVAADLELAYEGLPAGHLRDCLEGTEKFIRWQTAEPFSDVERTNRDELQKHMVKLGPVMQERYWLAMASHLISKRRFLEASALLDNLSDSSSELRNLRKEIERGASPAAPPRP